MYEYKGDEKQLFDAVQKKIETNARQLMYSLNNNWKLLGVDDVTRSKRTEELVKIVQERYDEVLEETLEKIKIIKSDIENLKKDAIKLGVRLGVQIETSPIKKDMPLNVIKETLENDLVRYRKMIATREEKLGQLVGWQKKLCHLLGCQTRDIPECPLPSEDELDEFAQYLREQEEEYERRVQIFIEKQKAIKELLDELEEEPEGSMQYYILKSSYLEFPVTDQNMLKVEAVHDNLVEQLTHKKNKVLDMRERLSILWERLEESPAYRADFLSNYPGHSRSTQAALEMELQRCEEKKRQSFKLFVSKVRSEIVDMWDKCLYSDLQREKFIEFYSNIYNEDLLMLHEMYLDQIKTYHSENKEIFDLYSTRQSLWLKWTELEARANEPGRFHNRGGQLLREEKERKTVSSQLPKIEAELTRLVELYESKNNLTFTVNGESLLIIMQRDWNQKNLEKKTKSSARKQLPNPAMSAPRSAPPARYVNNATTRAVLTAVKRRLSPRNSPNVAKSQILPRRLHLSPATPKVPNEEAPQAKKFKGTTPVIALNGYVLKKKSIGKRNQAKNKRRSRRSRASVTSDNECNLPDSTRSSYVDFQEHLNDKADSRSSVVPGRTLRSRMFIPQASSSAFLPSGQPAVTPCKTLISTNYKNKENIKDNNIFLSKVTPKGQKYASNKFGATPIANRSTRIPTTSGRTPNGKTITNVDMFATPRPVSKNVRSGLLHRQNTLALASPSPMDRNRPMLRSSSSHNLRSNLSPSYPLQSPKLQLATKLPLII